MKIKWIGHSCFLITSDSGVRIIMDPYKPDSNLNYLPVKESADIVTISHGHQDHNFIDLIPGKYVTVKESGEKTIKGIGIKGVTAWHDNSKGEKSGNNIIFCLNIDGIRLCHLGDLGHVLTVEQKKEVGMIDVLLIPIGGVFTIDAPAASTVCDDLRPKIAIPMHYKTDKCAWLQYDADDFIRGKKNFKKVGSSEIDIKKDSLPAEIQIVILEYTK